jgi:hypothetical protein
MERRSGATPWIAGRPATRIVVKFETKPEWTYRRPGTGRLVHRCHPSIGITSSGRSESFGDRPIAGLKEGTRASVNAEIVSYDDLIATWVNGGGQGPARFARAALSTSLMR